MDGEELRGRATVEEEGPIVQDTSPWRASHPSRKRACVAGWPLVYSAPGRFCEASAPERKTSTQVLHRRSEFVKTFLLRSVVIIMLVSGSAVVGHRVRALLTGCRTTRDAERITTWNLCLFVPATTTRSPHTSPRQPTRE
jgi:hypothetical protein